MNIMTTDVLHPHLQDRLTENTMKTSHQIVTTECDCLYANFQFDIRQQKPGKAGVMRKNNCWDIS